MAVWKGSNIIGTHQGWARSARQRPAEIEFNIKHSMPRLDWCRSVRLEGQFSTCRRAILHWDVGPTFHDRPHVSQNEQPNPYTAKADNERHQRQTHKPWHGYAGHHG